MREADETGADEEPLTGCYFKELRLQLIAILRHFIPSFSDLVRRMDGAFPTNVLAALRSLEHDGAISKECMERLSETSHPQSSTYSSVLLRGGGLVPEPALPEPHPLDYDWRFAISCFPVFDKILTRVAADKIATLGAPTLYLHLHKSGRSPSLYDKNAALLDSFRMANLEKVVCCDLLEQQSFNPSADVVIADPPWYLDHYAGFIAAAQQLLTEGGFLLLSLLPRLTRPSASSDRKIVFDLAHAKGFDMVEGIPGALLYRSPPFEVSSLRAEGVWHGNWRLGDLFVFKKTLRTPEQYAGIGGSASEQWESFTVGGTSVRVKRSSERNGHLQFETVSATGDIRLHSVSRRSPTRAGINLWTSRNLAFRITRPDYLSEVLLLNERGVAFFEAIDHVASTNHLSAPEKEVLRDIILLLVRDAEVNLDD
ncbi:MAG TPA: hypothetical protein VMF91_03940 [Bryobacteraceae bacterium]|nr:hypothetical protein [Bryobacteraceae bacterium]